MTRLPGALGGTWRIEAHSQAALTRIFLNGVQITNIVGYGIKGNVDGMTQLTVTLIPDGVEVDGGDVIPVLRQLEHLYEPEPDAAAEGADESEADVQ